MIVVSFATEDGKYDRCLAQLKQCCDAHSISHDLRLISPRPAIEAYRYKPTFILEMLRKHGDTVVWLDADAVIQKHFTVHGDWDIGLIPNNNPRWRKRLPMAAFVIAAAPTEGALRLLETWEELCRMPNELFDHELLMIARQLQTRYREGNILKQLNRAIVRDFGGPKEVPVLSNPVEAFVLRLHRAVKRRAVRVTARSRG